MLKGKFFLLKSILITLKDLLKTFRSQGLSVASILALVIFGFSLIFAFLSYSPILSPFIYPLF